MVRRHVDTGALYSALDAKRDGEGLSWRDLGTKLGVASSCFTRLAQGRGVDVDTFMTLTGWLGMSPDKFTTGAQSTPADEETLAVISSYLRADRSLKPKSAAAIETVLRAAYEQLAGK